MSEKNSSGMGSMGDSKHTLSEERNKNSGENAANIIGASAGGLDSITNFISTVTGKGGTNTDTNYNPPPPPTEKKTSPLLIGGIVGVSFLIIVILILTKNGQSKQ